MRRVQTRLPILIDGFVTLMVVHVMTPVTPPLRLAESQQTLVHVRLPDSIEA